MVKHRYLSVCSGIEAFSVAVHELDFEPVAFAEIEDFPSRVLAHRYPDVPNLGDMTKIDPTKLGRVDGLVGGTPCQSFSVAGLRGGLNDERGNLTLEYVRLAHELVGNNGLRWALWENVPGCLSDKTNAFGCFLGALVGNDGPLEPGPKPRNGKTNDFWKWRKPGYEPILDDEGEETGEFIEVVTGYHRIKWPDAGMVAGPRARIAWRILDSQHFGVPQRRRRVFVVVDFGNGPDPAAVLFEPRGQGRSFAARGEAGKDVAGTISARTQGGGGLGTDMELGGGLQVAPPVSQMNSRTGNERNEADAVVIYSGNAEGGNADLPSMNASSGKKGVNNQTPLVTVTAFGSKDHGGDAGNLAPTLKASGHVGSHANGGAPPAVAIAMRGGEGGVELEIGDNKANALRSADGGSSKPMAWSMMPQNSGKDFKAREVDVLQPLMAAGQSHGNQGGDIIQSGPQVRRLLPTECEALQGFPRDWTQIPGLSGWRDVGDDEDVADLESRGLEIRRTKNSNRLRVNDPDGPRYKGLGNSMTTEVINWIAARIQASLRGEPMPDWQPMRLWQKPRQ